MREPDFDLDMTIGRQGEMFAADLRRALQDGRVEVKTDRGFIRTGNIYVERECRYPLRGWRNTGIDNKNTAPLWLYLLAGTDIAVVFGIEALRRAAADPRVAYAAEQRAGSHPTKGAVVRLSRLFTPGALG